MCMMSDYWAMGSSYDSIGGDYNSRGQGYLSEIRTFNHGCEISHGERGGGGENPAEGTGAFILVGGSVHERG